MFSPAPSGGHFHYLQLAYRLQFGYNLAVLARRILRKGGYSKMFFFNCNSGCDFNCGNLWQFLRQLCGLGC